MIESDYSLATIVGLITGSGTVLIVVFLIIKNLVNNWMRKTDADYLTLEGLKAYCATCSKTIVLQDIKNGFDGIKEDMQKFSNVIKMIIDKQSDLREKGLKEFATVVMVEKSSDRIESALTKAVDKIENNTAGIFKRINEIQRDVLILRGVKLVENHIDEEGDKT